MAVGIGVVEGDKRAPAKLEVACVGIGERELLALCALNAVTLYGDAVARGEKVHV